MSGHRPPAAIERVLVVSSMATKDLLADLAAAHARRSGYDVEVVSVGGVDAARRVGAGEAFDVAVLASGAMAALAREGAVDLATLTGVARSGIAAAVPAGHPRPALADESDLAAALLAAPRIAYSTGPSGHHLVGLFDRLGIAADLAGRLVRARPGVPVASLLAAGDADIGFQQFSELAGAPGIEVVGPLPPGAQSITVFVAGVCAAARSGTRARAFVAALAAPETAEAKRRRGLDPA